MSSMTFRNPFTAAEIARTGSRTNSIISPLRETYSQHGEDLIIGSMLESLLWGSETCDLFYIDIGANHPIEISNTYLFYRCASAEGVLFEADPARIDELRRVRPRDTVVHTAISARHDEQLQLYIANASECSSVHAGHAAEVGQAVAVVDEATVPNMHITEALEKYWPDGPVHLLSIDIEGEDVDVLTAIDFTKYRPWIVCAEVFPRNAGQAILDCMSGIGYAVIGKTLDNFIFVDGSLI